MSRSCSFGGVDEGTGRRARERRDAGLDKTYGSAFGRRGTPLHPWYFLRRGTAMGRVANTSTLTNNLDREVGEHRHSRTAAVTQFPIASKGPAGDLRLDHGARRVGRSGAVLHVCRLPSLSGRPHRTQIF